MKLYAALIIALLLGLPACTADDGPGAGDVADLLYEKVGFDLVDNDADTAPDAGEVSLCQERFHAQLPSFGPTRTPAIGPEGNIYVASGDTLVRLQSEGLQDWAKPLEEGAVLGTPLVTPAGVYVGANSGMVYKVDLVSGDVMWSQPVQGAVTHAPVRIGLDLLVANAEGLAFISEPDDFTAFNHFLRPLDAAPSQPIALAADDRVIVTSGASMWLLDPANEGDAVPLLGVDEGALTSQVIPLGDGYAVVGAAWKEDGEAGEDPVDERGLLLVNLANGDVERLAVEGLLAGPSALVARSEREVWAFTSGGEGFLYNLPTDGGSGSSERFVLGGIDFGYPLLGNDGVWYVSTWAGQGIEEVTLYARDLTGGTSGSVLWSEKLPGSRPGGIAIAAGGTILFPVGLELHAYRCGTSSLHSDAPWPKFQRDSANSGSF